MQTRLKFVEVDASRAGLDRLGRFYRDLYVAAFPDADERESLANMAWYIRRKAEGWYGPNNFHVLVAEIDGRPIGGSVSDYLAGPNAGVIEFLFTRAEEQARGYGSALLQATERALQDDARRAGTAPLFAIVAEMNDPFRRPPTRDNMDPFERAAIWGHWGFAKLDFPYVQPALSPRKKPVRSLALVARLSADPKAAHADARWVRAVVREYMRWAMRIPQPARNPQFRAMARRLAAQPTVPLTPLRDYVGRNVDRGLAIEEVDLQHHAFGAMMALLHEALPFPGRTASSVEFAHALDRPAGGAYHYHLWRVASPPSERVQGLASFFTLARVGFGGYLVFARSLRGKGLLRPVIARIEERMVKDATGAEGWFIECDAVSAAPFIAVGFRELALDYRPPRVGAAAGTGAAERLKLLYKRFGSTSGPPPARRFVLEAVAAILRHVYGVRAPHAHACYRRLLNRSRPAGTTRLHCATAPGATPHARQLLATRAR
jgi:GNAT superfamily N-acetyltransferase